MNLLRSFPSSLTYLKQKKAGQKNHCLLYTSDAADE